MTRKKSRSRSQPGIIPLQQSLARYQPLLSQEDFLSLLAELERPLLGGLRINPLKARLADLRKWEARYGWETQPIPFCPSGYWLSQKKTNPGPTLEHHMGAFYLQDAASMLPVELFDFAPLPRPLILDMAASPGGKTTHLIANSGDRGLVIANDSSRSRIQALRVVLQTWGGVNYTITKMPGEIYGVDYRDVFDAVLLDAPCSMEGLRATEAHPLRPITEKERVSLARRQIGLLTSALEAVRPGGQVVYSTCTLAPEEDEAVLDAILRKFPKEIEIEDLGRKMGFNAPGLTDIGGNAFSPAVKNAFRLWPHLFGTAGFFAARLRKIGDIPAGESPHAKNPGLAKPMQSLSKVEGERVLLATMQEYGLDLRGILEEKELLLCSEGERIHLFPKILSERFHALPKASAGMLLGETIAGRLELSHEFTSRFHTCISRGKVTIPEEFKSAWLRGEDIPKNNLVDLPETRILMIYDAEGVFLGRGRVTSEKVKNLLPRSVIL